MDLVAVLRSIEPMEWLTIGLVLFAGAQVWLQYRTERQRRAQRAADREDSIDRAFHLAWAEHFRLEGLADELDRRDLIELAYLGVLDPKEVLPRDWGRLTEALAGLSREAGFLGGVVVSLCHDVQRSIAILQSSVSAFAREIPPGIRESARPAWLREHFGSDLAEWEAAARKGVRELSRLMWDAASHNPRIAIERKLDFSDELTSDFAKAAVRALIKRSGNTGTQSPD